MQVSSTEKYVETFYTWDRKEIATGKIIPEDSAQCFGPYYPAISQEDKLFYEGEPTAQIITKKTWRHGPFGNVKRYVNYGDSAYSDDDLIAEIFYNYDLSNHFLEMVSDLYVYNYNGAVIRRRGGHYNGLGRIDEITAYEGSNPIYTLLAYDDYGNIKTIQYPKNTNGNRLKYDYEYD
jgi:hypothetical protein